jgi:hypothetical protein
MLTSVTQDAEHESRLSMTRLHRFRRALVTPELIYGTIIVSAVIVVAEGDATDAEIFGIALVTMLVFWAAHIFAAAVATHGKNDNGEEIGLRQAFRTAMAHSYGLLYSALIPLAFLILGAVGLFDETTAYYCSLWSGTLILAMLGWMAFADRGSNWFVRILGALGTAFFGILVILLKAVIH